MTQNLVSEPYNYLTNLPPRCSPCGFLVAYVTPNNDLIIRSTHSHTIKRKASLAAFIPNIVAWDAKGLKVLVTGGAEVRVYWARNGNNQKSNISGPPEAVIRTWGIVDYAEWIGSDRLAVHSRDAGIQVWSDTNGVEIDIVAPKFRRLRSSPFTEPKVLTCITRPYTFDILEVYEVPFSNAVATKSCVSMEGITLDAKDVKVSPSTTFTAVLDSPCEGYSVLMFLDNQHLHTYAGPHYLTDRYTTIAATSIEWLVHEKTELLLIGDESDLVSILNPVTMKPTATLVHAAGAVYRDIPVWIESVFDGELIYTLANLPYTAPAKNNSDNKRSGGSSKLKLAVSQIDGYIATVPACAPRSVFIWSTTRLLAVLTHTQAVQTLEFNRTSQKLLISLEQCNFVGIWNPEIPQHPVIFQFSDLQSSAAFRSYWYSEDGRSLYALDGSAMVTVKEHNIIADESDDTKVIRLAAEVDANESSVEIENTFM